MLHTSQEMLRRSQLSDTAREFHVVTPATSESSGILSGNLSRSQDLWVSMGSYPCGELLKIDNILVHNAVNLAAEQVPVLPKNAAEEERAPSSWRAACSERCKMQQC